VRYAILASEETRSGFLKNVFATKEIVMGLLMNLFTLLMEFIDQIPA